MAETHQKLNEQFKIQISDRVSLDIFNEESDYIKNLISTHQV